MIDLNELNFKRRIGFGSTGEVYKAVWHNSVLVAVKVRMFLRGSFLFLLIFR